MTLNSWLACFHLPSVGYRRATPHTDLASVFFLFSSAPSSQLDLSLLTRIYSLSDSTHVSGTLEYVQPSSADNCEQKESHGSHRLVGKRKLSDVLDK